LLITSPAVQLQQHIDTREGITAHFNRLLEKILNDNSHKDKYWILGKAKIEKKKNGKEVVRPFLQACAEKPNIIRESFVYEVDNTRGTKTLLWIMHPGDLLSFPTLGKSIRVTGGTTGSTILLPKHR
jgi:hypothetical protein